MRNLFLLVTLTTLSITQSCKNPNNNTDHSNSNTEANVLFYKHYSGTIGDKNVVLNLASHVKSGLQETLSNYSGYLLLNESSEPQRVYGDTDSTGNIKLTLWNNNDESESYFLGRFDKNQSFSGTYTDTLKKLTQPFKFTEAYPEGTMQFEHRHINDSIKLFKNVVGSPTANFEINMPLPKTTRKDVADFLNPEIFKLYNSLAMQDGESTAMPKNKSLPFTDANIMMRAYRDSFFTMYKANFKDEKPNAGSEYFGMNYTSSTSTDIIYNERDLLSLATSSYEFTGGAHGNHATVLTSYNLAEKKQIGLDAIFKQGYETTLNKVLEKVFRQKYKLTAKDSIATILFGNSIEANDNFCLTNKGILFLYNPYEIGNYALGEIELFIPFTELASVMNPNWKM